MTGRLSEAASGRSEDLRQGFLEFRPRHRLGDQRRKRHGPHLGGQARLVGIGGAEHDRHVGALADFPRGLEAAAAASQDWASFTAIAPATLELLATKNIALVGIDTPSVDPATSQDLPSHHLLLQHGLRVLENLVLDDVPAGDYELIALPLKLMQADASPVRAILRAL